MQKNRYGVGTESRGRSNGSLPETRRDFPHADLTGVCTVFNIKGNDYRLISKIYYPNRTVLVRFVLTHVEYDKGNWEHDCEC